MIHKGSTWDGQKGAPKDLQGGSPGGPFFMYWWMTRMNKCTQWLKHASSSNPTNHQVSLRKKLTSSLHFWIGGKTFERLVHLSNCNLSSRGDPGAPWWPPFEILMVRRTFSKKINHKQINHITESTTNVNHKNSWLINFKKSIKKNFEKSITKFLYLLIVTKINHKKNQSTAKKKSITKKSINRQPLTLCVWS